MKVYINSKYGYSIKYPPNFIFSSIFPDKYPDSHTSPLVNIHSTSSFKNITIYGDIVKSEKQSLREYVDQTITLLNSSDSSNDSSWEIIQKSIVNEHEAIFVRNNVGTNSFLLDVFIERTESQVVRIHLGSGFQGTEDEYKEFFYRIVSTFEGL